MSIERASEKCEREAWEAVQKRKGNESTKMNMALMRGCASE